MNVTELPKLYTEEQLAAKLEVSAATLARARRAGKLPFTRIGNRVRYTAAHLAAYLEKQECGSTSKTETASGTSAGHEPMGAQAAHQLAREIAMKPTRSSRGTSSSTRDRETNG
jgi:excisionase family DNA binding protein